jgi:betaine-aldehyde dehydrogenase
MNCLPEPYPAKACLPKSDELFYGGGWHRPIDGRYMSVTDPSTGAGLGRVAVATSSDADRAVTAALAGFAVWRRKPPLERAAVLRAIAGIIRDNVESLALLDAIDGGNPVKAMAADILSAAKMFDFFAGLVTEMKGHSIPMGSDAVDYTVREPRGVVARIVAFNHPFMFTAAKAAAPLAAGNAVIIKASTQAPLSSLRFAELVGGLLPNGVLSILTGDQEIGRALTCHPDVAMVTLVGSVSTGRAVMKGASETLKPVLLELGGKNALIAYPDAAPDEVAEAAVRGMNFTWCGQSCGSTSRLFLHEKIHEAVVDRILDRLPAFKPGRPSDPTTTMGAIIDRRQYDRIRQFIDIGTAEGARLVYGGKHPGSPDLKDGFFIEPTMFVDVRPHMRIAREEIFGPVLSVLSWADQDSMISDVNDSELGLTCSIWTNDLRTAHLAAARVQAGFVWINEVGKHFLGAPFGGYKQSGIGREECLDELLSFTQEKNIHINLKRS